ncbi:MAG: hypothetical protein GYB26_02495 [Gammaproteobacteria bacterium]|uniref:Uncharacterized protein n=1 Tax=Marinobacter litoralis TaxID=187981 RepID=A0A3M2RBM8_9GAMM|nr:hypothetical protein [Marinobacter litoralis]MBR9869991.1 hypothetical protein [Gammaproteobacteria bacterium]RMJ02569.1 hypothetical protein DOQ08_02032 [Marinobacter litoralis]
MDHARHLPKRPLGLTLVASLVLSAAIFIALLVMNQPLKTASAPQGMISFQLAGTAQQAQAIIASWKPEGVSTARASLWVDFAFIAAYLAMLLQLTRRFSQDRPGVRERIIAKWVRTLFIVAGTSDVIENIALLNNFNPPDNSLSIAASIFSLLKFTGLLLGLAGLIIIRAARRQPLTPAS